MNRRYYRRRKHKAASMAATSLLATSALLGTYLGNPRLNRAYATITCTAATAAEFNTKLADSNCTTIEITASFTATSNARTLNDVRSSLTIRGVGDGISITGGGTGSDYKLLSIESNTTLTISNLTVKSFESTGDGGAIYTKGSLNIQNSSFSDNAANSGTYGGAIFARFTTNNIEITNSSFSRNSAYNGGALYLQGDLNLNSSVFTENSAAYNGGALFLKEDLILNNSTFSQNSAYYNGGALFSEGDSTLNNSTFVQNSATYDSSSSGGAILSTQGSLQVTNSTFSDNESYYGGAILSDNNLDVHNTIFQNNAAVTSGDDIWLQASYTINISYSLFNSNSTIFDSVASALVDWGTLGPGLISGDPLLGPLQDNGGPTQTMLPGSGSPAIDAGSNALAVDASSNPLTTDQRGTGFARIAGASVDMGAVEVQGSSGGGWDGSGLNSLTSVLLQDQSGLDKTWSDHDILLNSLQTVLSEKPNSELKVLADGTVRLTAFIPTDRAFRRFAFDLTGIRPRSDKQTMRVIESLDLETIEKVLLYHVVLGDPISSEAALRSNGVLLTTLSGESFRLRVTNKPNIFLRDNNKDFKNPKVLLKRVDINNGNRQVAHVINRVLIPIEDLK